MKNTPKAGQTFYTVSGMNRTAKLERHFIVAVKMSKLAETNIGLKSTFKGRDENGLFVMSQELVKEKRNHLILLTRSGRAFDYGADKLYFTKKQANKAYRKALKTYIFMDEAWGFHDSAAFSEMLSKTRRLHV